jgi:hypothetical protein
MPRQKLAWEGRSCKLKHQVTRENDALGLYYFVLFVLYSSLNTLTLGREKKRSLYEEASYNS